MKYRTPKLEEFKHGFKFEITNTSYGGIDIIDFSKDPVKVIRMSEPNIPYWEDTIYSDIDSWYPIGPSHPKDLLQLLIKEKRVRVKK